MKATENQETTETLNNKNDKKGKSKKGINAYVLLFLVIVIMAIASYILPAGQYQRHDVDGRSVVVPNSYTQMDRTPTSFLSTFAAVHEGMVEAGPIIFYVFIIGGMIGILNSTGALEGLLSATSARMQKNRLMFVAVLVLLFALGGSLIGMAEESLIYIPIVVPFALMIGYDMMTGIAIVSIGMATGFTTAILNPFTVGIAQSIAELPMFSGMWLRVVLFVALYVAVVTFLYRHGEKVRANRSLGIWDDTGIYSTPKGDRPFTIQHKIILALFVLALASLVIGVLKYNWYMGQYAGVFIIVSILIAVVAKIPPDRYMTLFLKGASDILPGALIIGVAKGIVVVLTNSHIIDTILYGASSLLSLMPAHLTVAGMFIVQGIIHFLVPSGSGQAMLTMPIMTPLADLLGITRQTTALVFTLADGIGNTWLPTGGILMAVLSMHHIPYRRWLGMMLPFIIGEYLVAMAVCVGANALGYGPF